MQKAPSQTTCAARTTPNIVLITWHDAGRWFGCYGNPHVHTPNVDRFAAEGCRFANTFSACAICSPSRAAIVTGRHCQDNGVMFLTNTVNNNRFHAAERHVARLLKEEHGYRTALFGVQHECAHEHVSEILAVDERFATDPWRSADRVADRVVPWLRERKEDARPFYAQIGWHEAHLGSYHARSDLDRYPWVRDEEHGLHVPPYLADSPSTHEAVAVLQGLLRRGDAAVGRILDALRESGREQDTLVCMCVDHGVGLPAAKTTCYDPGLAVAWVVRYPRAVAGATVVEAMTAQVDVLPTLLELAGLPIPANVQGMSFAGHALGRRHDEQRDACFSHMVENTRSVRTHRHKFIRHFRKPSDQSQSGMATVPERARILSEAPRVELYDLATDPNEFTNLAGRPAHAAAQAELDRRLWNFLLDHNDFIVNEPVNSRWQAETRRELLAHCEAAGRPAPVIDG